MELSNYFKHQALHLCDSDNVTPMKIEEGESKNLLKRKFSEMESDSHNPLSEAASDEIIPQSLKMFKCDSNQIDSSDFFAQPEEGPINYLPVEILYKIFSNLHPSDLGRCGLVSKQWQILANDESLIKTVYTSIPLGKKELENFFGKIGEEPPLPKNILDILKSPCPFWRGKRVVDTHMLVLIPKEIDGHPLNINKLREIVKFPKQDNASVYKSIKSKLVFNKHGDTSCDTSHWVLMTKDIVPKSSEYININKNPFAEKNIAEYQIPKILDVVFCIFTEYFSSGLRLFPNVYTYCQEDVSGFSVVVGGFTHEGLSLENCYYVKDEIGVAAMRILKNN